mmetsp:Transcript_24981/g.38783  ORF Transcript_24981/g.38783 Transcript_24981/m.38783 type:complete len:178 (+) Transcript_24981:2041-2574(+)
MSLEVKKFQKKKINEISSLMESLDMKSVNMIVKQIQQVWRDKLMLMLKDPSKKQKRVTQKELMKVKLKMKEQQYVNPTSKTFFSETMLDSRIRLQIHPDTSHSRLFATFKLDPMINDMIFAKLDYQEWLVQRQEILRTQSVFQEIRKIQQMNMNHFWAQNSRILKTFLRSSYRHEVE